MNKGEVMDATVLRMVVVALGLVCTICLVGIILLASLGQEPPAALAAICSIAAGALVGILVPSGRPVSVEVTREQRRPPDSKDKA